MSIPYLYIDRTSSIPIPEQIAEQFISAIRAKRLKPGQSLPTVRELSKSLQISMETAQKAYQLLKKDGWITSKPRHGTTVSAHLPQSTPMLAPKRHAKRLALLQTLKAFKQIPGLYPVSGISLPPDPVLLQALKEVSNQALDSSLKVEESDPFGVSDLRSKIQGLLVERGIWSDLSSLCIFNGSQQAIWLIADLLLKPGDIVVIPETCYLPIKEIFQSKGAQVVSIRQVSDGIDLDHLEQICQKKSISLLFTMPNGHYPTGASWSEEKKRAVIALAQKRNFPILEDDFYAELYYTPIPPTTLYALATNMAPNVSIFYTSSFHMLIHTNIRLGYLIVPEPYVEIMHHAKSLVDKTASVFTQYLLLHLWEKINFPNYLKQLRQRLKTARNQMLESLERWLPPGYTFSSPQVGITTWVHPPHPMDETRFIEQCLAEHVFVMPGEAFAVEQPVPGFQVNFGKIPPEILDQAIQRIGKILRRYHSSY
ncbi:aminotransferase-like domain-containing protein [Thermoflavimicrobium dichotomicum]|uniref:DNA-binding transcriptional regulator, MocR family, contains an aminotransferase domain n=1 Tax=Thermoflavimicrobium dichotomicum TaxID=46223 RepID=A0A1I3TH54_9BACL|nr:PLP-dependent aminotransferase family protein [Thermoflavimicrobium dichotomicum]SFJ68847.1 DNA-binding transcriptional regulator, MocR family, contains an aminotransferase domain [Thermoflavimicrobium dichotomicum]